MLFSIVAIPIYIPTNRVGGFCKGVILHAGPFSDSFSKHRELRT